MNPKSQTDNPNKKVGQTSNLNNFNLPILINQVERILLILNSKHLSGSPKPQIGIYLINK